MINATSLPSFPSAACARGGEHVLVVEDEELLRRHVVKQVVSLGYRVSEAPDGLAGMKIIREQADVDLLFTDIVMPGMSGCDLAKSAGKLRPDLRILFTSGFSRDWTQDFGWLNQEFDLLQKPYRRQDLAQSLRKAFES